MARKKKETKPVDPDMFSRWLTGELGTEVVREYKFHPVRRWRFDYAIPEHKVAVEIEGGVWTGGRHISPRGFLGDIEKYNTATSMGWALLRFQAGDQFSVKALEVIKSTITTKNQISNRDGKTDQ